VEAQCAQLLSEHRLNAVPPGDTLRPVLQPTAHSASRRRKCRPCASSSNATTSTLWQIPHPSNAVKDPESERDRLRTWLAAFDIAAKELGQPHLVFYTYLKDEPNTLEDYRYVQKWGRAIRDARSAVKVLRGRADLDGAGPGRCRQRLGRFSTAQ